MARSTGLSRPRAVSAKASCSKSGRPRDLRAARLDGGAKVRTHCIAWDGGPSRARVGDALVFLERASDVEVVSVTGKTTAGLAPANRAFQSIWRDIADR